MVSLQTLRDRKAHDERRRVWSAAFGDKAVRGYEQRLLPYLNHLMAYFSSQAVANKPVNVIKWFELYSYDFMGNLTFGKSFGMLEAHQDHWAIDSLKKVMIPLGFAFPTWFFRVVISIPGLSRAWQRLFDFCGQRMLERIKTPAEIPDIASVLVAPLKGQQPSQEQWELLRGDAQLVVLAGGDTTATTLSAAVYQLVQHPEQVQRLRDEVSPYIAGPSHEVLHEKIANLPHLNAIINETLRLHPPAATALQRKTPPEGIIVDGVHIPGNMTVMCPQNVLGRSEAVYERPMEFLPERWYLQPELVKDKSAFVPFSIGPYGCIGKPLALLTIRNTLMDKISARDGASQPFASYHNSDNQMIAPNNAIATEYPSPLRLTIIVFALFLAIFLTVLEQTIIRTAIPIITDQFNSVGDIGWYGSVYFLTGTALQPAYGRMYMLFDMKWSFLVVIFIFELGSLICAIAPNSATLIGGRAVAGTGVGGIFSGALVILSLTDV
ncbi:hypothetical protein AnigIFM59636_010174 [Aspergillus niger]|nr:hypothetical protein AnigIFM59636_010174 [Aspergillus niger]